MTTLLGCFVGNPDGSNAANNAAFNAAFDAHAATLGKTPQCMNAFVSDNGSGWGTAASSPPVSQAQWTAWSWSLNTRTKSLVPVVAVPMIFAGGSAVPQIYTDIAAGMYDFVWTGIVNAWKTNGFPLIYARIGWEFNGSWNTWYTGNLTAAGLTAWIAAWNHIATVMKAVTGITVKTVWNPNLSNWDQYDATTQCYPTASLVDVIGIDAYSPCYTANSGNLASGQPGYYDWVLNNWTLDDLPTWMAKAGNREHFWDWPGSNGWNPTNNNNATGLQKLLAFCAAQGKPIALPECGAGVSPQNPANSRNDDAAFPKYLGSRLFGKAGAATASANPPVPVELINVWDTNVGDGLWQFYKAPAAIALNGTLAFNTDGSVTLTVPAQTSLLQPSQQPKLAAAWTALAVYV